MTAPTNNSLRRRFELLSRYPAAYWKGWVFIIFVTLLATGFSLLQPWPMKVLVDHVFDKRPVSEGLGWVMGLLPGAETSTGLLIWVAVAGLAIFVVNSALDILLTFSWIKVGQRMVYDLTCDLFSHAQRRSLVFHNKNSVGDIMSRITGDSWAINTITDTLLFKPAHALVMTIAMVIVMANISLDLTLIALVVAPLMTLVSAFFGKRLRSVARDKRETESRIQAHVQQTLSGMAVVQAFSQEDREHSRFRQFAKEAIGAQKRSILTGSVYGLFSGGFNSISAGAILYIGAYQVIGGQMTIGGLLVFMAYLGTLQAELKQFTGIYGSLQTASAGLDRIMELMDAPGETTRLVKMARIGPIKGAVRFANVSFEYEPSRPTLKNITFDAKPGETIALVGPTGVGKSTLVSLIPRFFEPTEGVILVDGRDIRKVDLKMLRQQIGIVLQEPFLFPFSIAENIAFGHPAAKRDEIESAAKAANAHEFISRLPDGYDTVIGQKGSTLSGGEKQRLSIARALLKNAPILILDEPTSALDSKTEAELLEALEHLMKGRTTFIIAHRLSTIQRADQILVLEGGSIVERGRHEELIENNGLYASFCKIQFEGRRERRVA